VADIEVTRGDEPLVFQQGIESFRKSLNQRLTPSLAAEAKAMGLDFERPPIAISLATWEAVVGHIAARFYPDLPESERYFALGRQFMLGYTATTIGSAVLKFARVMGVRRTLHRMGKNFSTVANFIETESTDLGSNQLQLATWMRPDLLARHRRPTLIFANYRRGVLQETLALLGATGTVKVNESNVEKQRVVFAIQWQ
jgi:uncharacterized protein (TIGR02265 family)